MKEKIEFKKSKKGKYYYENDNFMIILSKYGGVVISNKLNVNDTIFCLSIDILKKELKRVQKKKKLDDFDLKIIDSIENKKGIFQC